MKKKRIKILSAALCILMLAIILPEAGAIDNIEQDQDINIDKESNEQFSGRFFIIGIIIPNLVQIGPWFEIDGFYPILVLRIGSLLERHILGPLSGYIDLDGYNIIRGKIDLNTGFFICVVLEPK